MNEALDILGWMLLAVFVVAALPLARSVMRARRPGRHGRPLRIRETDPNDVYTC